MDEKLSIEDFDILGIIKLKDVHGIEKFVTPIYNTNNEVEGYLSRSKEYYNVKTMTELAIGREELKGLLSSEPSKRNFVILENMLNYSAKVYFRKLEQFILNNQDPKFELQVMQAEACLMDDIKNMLVVLSGEGVIDSKSELILPGGVENSQKRAIEMDNKAMLYEFAKTLKMKKPENVEILTPGYGSLYIGPILKAMYGYGYTHMLKSKYILETVPQYADRKLQDLISSERIFLPGKTVLLLDDNIGTGQTMHEIKDDLQSNGISDILTGAIQYNWRNYYRVSIGEKRDIPRFDVNDFDFISPFNYAGHKLYEHAIDALHSSGSDYIKYLNSKHYRVQEHSDLEGAINRSIVWAGASGLNLTESFQFPELTKYIEQSSAVLPEYKNSAQKITNPFAINLINGLIEKIIPNRSISNKKQFPEGEDPDIN